MENAGPGSRGKGSRGVENTGSNGKHGSGGKHGVSVENTGSKWKVAILLFQIAMKINQRETCFFELNIS